MNLIIFYEFYIFVNSISDLSLHDTVFALISLTDTVPSVNIMHGISLYIIQYLIFVTYVFIHKVTIYIFVVVVVVMYTAKKCKTCSGFLKTLFTVLSLNQPAVNQQQQCGQVWQWAMSNVGSLILNNAVFHSLEQVGYI